MDPDKNITAEITEPDERGIPTAKWEKLGFAQAAENSDVQATFPGHQGPIAVGLLRMWKHASREQRGSAEYQETFNSANKDFFPDAPEVVF